VNERSHDVNEMELITRPAAAIGDDLAGMDSPDLGLSRSAWLRLGDSLPSGESKAKDQLLLTRLDMEFREERTRQRNDLARRWAGRAGLVASLAASIVMGVYLWNQSVRPPNASELVWDDDFQQIVTRVDRAIDSLPGISPSIVEFETLVSDVEWVESLGDAESF
jgi:hypothetical protein